MENPDWAKLLTVTIERLNHGFWSQNYVDIIFQKWRDRPDIYDAYGFLQVHCAIRGGRIAIFQAPMSCTPFGDKETDKDGNSQNDLALQLLESPFRGEFWGGLSDSDGYFQWEKPINVLRCESEENTIGFNIVPPLGYGVPLEVGTTAAEITFAHLGSPISGNGGLSLARWPYGQDRITVLVDAGLCYGIDSEGFQELRETSYGDFRTLPNPWDDWIKSKTAAHIPTGTQRVQRR